jgi:hypothetical protein
VLTAKLYWRRTGGLREKEGLIDEVSALGGWHTSAEKSWLHYGVSLLRAKNQDWEEAEKLLRESVLAADPSAWEFLLARAKLEQMQKRRQKALKTKAQWSTYNEDIQAFDKVVKLRKISELYPQNRKIFVTLAFYSAADEDWSQSLEYTRTFLKGDGRQNADRMSLGILEAGILHIHGT